MEGEYPHHPNQVVDLTPKTISDLTEKAVSQQSVENHILEVHAGDRLMEQINSGGVKVLDGDRGLEETQYENTIDPKVYAERLVERCGNWYSPKERKTGKAMEQASAIEAALVKAQQGFSETSDTRIDLLRELQPHMANQPEYQTIKKQLDYFLSLDKQQASELIATIMDWNYPKDPTPEQEYHRYKTITDTLAASGSTELSFGSFRRLMETVNDAVVNTEKRTTTGHIPPEIVTAAMRQPHKYTVDSAEGRKKIALKDSENIEGPIDPFHPKEGLQTKVEEKFGQESEELNSERKAALDKLSGMRGDASTGLSDEERQSLFNNLTTELARLDTATRDKIDDWYPGRLSQEERFPQTIAYLRTLLSNTSGASLKDRDLYNDYIAPLSQNHLHTQRLESEHKLAQSFVDSQPESVLQAIATGELYAKGNKDLMRELANIQSKIGQGLTITEDSDAVHFTFNMGKDPFDSLYRYKDIRLRDARQALTTYSAHNQYLFDTVQNQDGKTIISVKKLIA